MLTPPKQVTEMPRASVSSLRNRDSGELLTSTAKHNVWHRTNATLKVPIIMKVTMTMPVMSPPNMEAKASGVAPTQRTVAQFQGASQSLTYSCLLHFSGEVARMSCSTVISKCLLPTAMKHTKSGDTRGS